MDEQRFAELREALLRAGVATRHVRRAVLEIESHFRQLVDEERGRGSNDAEAPIEAHRRLGTNQVLIQRYAARPELLGIIVISALASLINVAVMFRGGPNPGEVGAGIGFSTKSLPQHLTRATILALPALLPLWVGMRRLQRNYTVK
jgi:hypothetical protein